MNQEQKFESWAEKELSRARYNTILEDACGGYIVFGLYRLYPEGSLFVVENFTEVVHKFSSKKSALAWCTADCRGRYNLASQIRNLDSRKQQLVSDIASRQNVSMKSRNQDFVEIVNTKLEPKIQMLRNVVSELEKCIGSAKYIQIRGFTNETARIHGH